MTRRDHIERIYQNHGEPFDNLWEWATNGRSKRERYLRFRELQRWAKHKRREGNRSGDTWEQWDNRHDAYRRQKRKVFSRINDHPATGTGSWGGSMSVIEREVIPVYTRFGAPVTSKKRWQTFGNPSSDHYMGNTTAYAADAGVGSAYTMGHAIKAKLTGDGGARMVDYQDFWISRSGNSFRIELIAVTHGTGPHFHSGCRRS